MIMHVSRNPRTPHAQASPEWQAAITQHTGHWLNTKQKEKLEQCITETKSYRAHVALGVPTVPLGHTPKPASLAYHYTPAP